MEHNRNSQIKNIPPAHHTASRSPRKTVSLVTAWMFHKGMVIRFSRVQFLNGLIWNSLLFCFVKSFQNVLELGLKTMGRLSPRLAMMMVEFVSTTSFLGMIGILSIS
jgi:hypothetical protein